MAETSTPIRRATTLTLAVASGLVILAAEGRWAPILPAQARSLALLALAAAAGYAAARLIDLRRQAVPASPRPAAAREAPPDAPRTSLLLSRARFALESRQKSQDPPGTVCPSCGAVSASHRYALQHRECCRVAPLAELVCQLDPSVRVIPAWVEEARAGTPSPRPPS